MGANERLARIGELTTVKESLKVVSPPSAETQLVVAAITATTFVLSARSGTFETTHESVPEVVAGKL